MKKSLEDNLIDALDAMGEAIAVWDEDDRLIYYNSKYQDFFELKDRVRLGAKFQDLIEAHISSDEVQSFDGIEVKSNPVLYSKMRYEYHIKCEGVFIDSSTDGRWRQIKERKFNGNMRIGIYTDITEQKRNEQLLNKAKNELEIANQAKSNFLANITHELKTPLHAILSYAQLIKVSQSNIQTSSNAIISSAEYLTSMIDDMIEKTKLDISDSKLEYKSIRITSMIDDISKMFSIIANNKGIEFSIKEENLPTLIKSDERKIKQILINLIGNGIKFTQKGKVSLKIKGIDKGIKFTIEDTGIGVEKENFEKIFNPFEKLENDLNSQGTGLGLSISNEYAKLLYEPISIKSKIGKGSVFSFIVPLEQKQSDKLIIKNKINFKNTDNEDIDISVIDKKQKEDIKKAIQLLYYSKLEEIFNSFDEVLKNELLKYLKNYEWDKLNKIFI